MSADRPDLTTYDWLLVNSSAGKDSQVALDETVRQADALGIPRSRIVVVHADLGRVEWAGTRELAERQAAHYGLRFEVVSRGQDLLEQVEARHAKLRADGKLDAAPWFSPKARYCTSDQKRDPIRRVMTKLATEWRAAHPGASRPCRILNIMGLRAQESPARSKLEPFERDEQASNGRRTVDVWLPIHAWTVEDVWTRIRATGVPYHRAYDLGMPRLSCCFCMYAPDPALVLAGRHNPELLDAYIAVEDRTGFTMKPGLSLKVIRDRVQAGEQGAARDAVSDWCM